MLPKGRKGSASRELGREEVGTSEKVSTVRPSSGSYCGTCVYRRYTPNAFGGVSTVGLSSRAGGWGSGSSSSVASSTVGGGGRFCGGGARGRCSGSPASDVGTISPLRIHAGARRRRPMRLNVGFSMGRAASLAAYFPLGMSAVRGQRWHIPLPQPAPLQLAAAVPLPEPASPSGA